MFGTLSLYVFGTMLSMQAEENTDATEAQQASVLAQARVHRKHVCIAEP
jgi:hypothetical protein